MSIMDAALQRLQCYQWPGNVRELQNVIERAIILTQAEYREMPGLCLTKSQIQRRWDLDGRQVEAVLERLTAARFLQKTKVGYALARDAAAPSR